MTYKYRPEANDDWGVVKSVNDEGGTVVLILVKKYPHPDLEKCDALNTDPWEDIGREIVNKLNSYDDMLKWLEELYRLFQDKHGTPYEKRALEQSLWAIKKARGE